MKNVSNKLVAKGVFALAAVAIVGTTTAAYAITNSTTNSTSGYGNSSEAAIAASQDFDAQYASLTSSFSSSTNALIAQAKSKLGPNATKFDTQFQSFTASYNDAVTSASARFRSEVAAAINSGESKDTFIDSFNRAKAAYFNALDAAKNEFAANVSGLGNDANVAKDTFIGGYNSVRNAYGNSLESAKNTFADRVSNGR